MKQKNILLTFLLLFISLISFAQDQKEADILSLKKLVEESFQDLFTEFKSEKIASYYTDDFLLIENGEIWNTDSVRNYLAKARLRTPKPTRENKFDFFKMEIMDDVAWLSYHNYATFTTNSGPPKIIHWLETVIAIRTTQGWRIKLLHNSPGEK